MAILLLCLRVQRLELGAGGMSEANSQVIGLISPTGFPSQVKNR